MWKEEEKNMLHQMKLLMVCSLSCALMVILVLKLNAADLSPAVAAQTDLRLNEYMTANTRSLEDPDEPTAFPDWLELYNPGSAAVSLDGLYLTNDEADPTRFPIANGLTIPAGGFLIFYADNDPGQGPLHTNFTLLKDGGYIGLYHGDTQTLIDSRSYIGQTNDVAEGRDVDGSGNWRTFIQVTPGASNMLLPPRIRSVELSPSQPLTTSRVQVTAEIIDDSSSLTATLFYSSTGETSFTAVAMTQTVGQSESYVGEVPMQPDGAVVRYYVAAADSSGLTTLDPVSAPARPYLYVVGFQAPMLYINEFMAENESVLENPDLPGNFPDWIEIYNPGATPVSLDGLFLTDSPNRPTTYAIPDGLVAPAEGFLLFYADGRPDLGPQHTNFTLSPDGEDLRLYGAQGAFLVDSRLYPAQDADTSYVRFPDGDEEWALTVCTTPAAANQLCAEPISLPLIHK
jgi:hypothetical protein